MPKLTQGRARTTLPFFHCSGCVSHLLLPILCRYVVHVGSLAPGTGPLKVGDALVVSVDYDRRAYIAPNHTMTHVLNYALKTVLLGDKPPEGVTIDQKGSLVDAEKLRFDFTWSGALSAAQVIFCPFFCRCLSFSLSLSRIMRHVSLCSHLFIRSSPPGVLSLPTSAQKVAKIEETVKQQINEARPVFAEVPQAVLPFHPISPHSLLPLSHRLITPNGVQSSALCLAVAQVVPLAAASQICSLRAVFGERYPDPVRVISVGADVKVRGWGCSGAAGPLSRPLCRPLYKPLSIPLSRLLSRPCLMRAHCSIPPPPPCVPCLVVSRGWVTAGSLGGPDQPEMVRHVGRVLRRDALDQRPGGRGLRAHRGERHRQGHPTHRRLHPRRRRGRAGARGGFVGAVDGIGSDAGGPRVAGQEQGAATGRARHPRSSTLYCACILISPAARLHILCCVTIF